MDSAEIKEINEKIQAESAFIDLLNLEMNKVIIGQKHMLERLLIGLLGNGHILLEGVPGLAKTLAINTLSKAINGKFSRIQFTPDLVPMFTICPKTNLPLKKGRFLETLFSQMKSIGHQPKFSQPFWRPCKSVK